jgi:NADPH:quinone reductase-like Zn-dependent oxidoreductase
VRRDEQADLLRSLGATHILNSSAADFAEALRATCRRLQATVTFEAVAGDLTGLLLENMPPGSTIYVYGALSQQACGRIDPIDLIFREQTVAGFFLGTWLRKQGSLGMLRLARRVQQLLLNGTIVTSIQRRLTLDQAVDGLRQYVEHMTDGKVLICP